MQLSYQDITGNEWEEWGKNVFLGKFKESPLDWRSAMPDMSTFVAKVMADPANAMSALSGDDAKEMMANSIEAGLTAAWRFATERSVHNVVTGNRQLFAGIVQTTGILSRDFKNIKKVYATNVDSVYSVTSSVKVVWESELFQKGLDAIGMIPVVGWIIDIVLSATQSIAKMFESAYQEKSDYAMRQIAERLSIPLSATVFDSDTDQTSTQNLLRSVSFAPGHSSYNPQAVIMPAYKPYSGSAVSWKATGVFDDGDPDGGSKGAMGWIVSGGAGVTGGFGLVPGTSNITRSIFLPSRMKSRAPAAVGFGPRDMGSLYPSAAGLANSWWSMALRPGPTMFTIRTDEVRDAWDNYVYALLVLAKDTVKGWTAMPAANPQTDRFLCAEFVKGIGSCKRDRHFGDTFKIPSEWGRTAHTLLALYVYKLFFGKTEARKIPTRGALMYQNDLGWDYPDPHSVDMEESIPSRNLWVMRERQLAVLRSPDLFYVDGRDPETFHAFAGGNANPLKAEWEANAQALMEAGEWRRATFIDMPEGDLKAAVRQQALAHNMVPEKLGSPCPPGVSCPMTFKLSAGPSVLGDPTPPGVIPPLKLVQGTRVPSGGGGGSGLILGAAALAMFAMINKKRR